MAPTARSLAMLVVLACLAAVGSSAAAAAPKGDKVAAARKLYDAKRYPEALAACDKALANAKLAKTARVECLQIQAFALFLLSQADNARKTWLELLKVDPAYKVDPVMVTPEFVSFFGRITPEDAASTAPPPGVAPEPPAATPAPTPAAAPVEVPPEASDSADVIEPMPRTLPASARPGAEPGGNGTTEILATAPLDATGLGGTPTSTAVSPALARPCGVFLCLLPFGVGQFVNGQPLKGALLAAGEVGFLATNLALYWARVSEVDTYGRLQNPDGAETGFVIQHVALGLFAAALVGGIVDAFLFTP